MAQKSILTKKDLDYLKNILASKKELGDLRSDFEDFRLEVKEKFQDLEGKIKNLPTKNEFFTAMDQIIGELKKVREEQTILGQHTVENKQRVDFLEKHLLKIEPPSR